MGLINMSHILETKVFFLGLTKITIDVMWYLAHDVKCDDSTVEGMHVCGCLQNPVY